jgi:carboxylate-amine ligase
MRGAPAPTDPEALLRLAAWQAALRGVRGPLVDPTTGEQAPASLVIARLIDHIRAALERAGDLELVLAVVSTILEDGTGADRQRAAARTGMQGVVRHAVLATHTSPGAQADRSERWLPAS